MSDWLNAAHALLASHPQWLALAIFAIALLECLAIVGILLPGVVLLFGVATLAGSGHLSLAQTLLWAWAGALCGDLLSYTLGRSCQARLQRLPWLRDHPQALHSAEQYMQRYGMASLLVGRFIGPLRPLLPMTAGMLRLPAGQFLAISLLASAGWAVAYLLPGWATGAALRLPLSSSFWQQAGLLALGLLGLLLIAAQASLRERRQASLLCALLALAGLLGLLLGWPWLEDFDRGLMHLVQSLRQPWLDSWMVWLTRLGDLRSQLLAGLLLVALLTAARQRQAALWAAIVLIGCALSNAGLKLLLARSRPDVLQQALETHSLPSGHSAAAFALCLVLGVLAGRGQPARLRLTWLAIAALPATAIALSRLYLGVHWPSDILAGALLAMFCCAGGLYLMQQQQRLPALPRRLWLGLLPLLLVVLAGLASWQLDAAVLRYRY